MDRKKELRVHRLGRPEGDVDEAVNAVDVDGYLGLPQSTFGGAREQGPPVRELLPDPCRDAYREYLWLGHDRDGERLIAVAHPETFGPHRPVDAGNTFGHACARLGARDDGR